MICLICRKTISIKDTERYITLLCKCGMTVIYPDRQTRFISKKDYDPQHKSVNVCQ